MKVRKKAILALDAPSMDGIIFCNPPNCWGSISPGSDIYDIRYLSLEDIDNNEKISDEEFIKLNDAFFTLYLNRAFYYPIPTERKERHNAFVTLYKSGLTRRFENMKILALDYKNEISGGLIFCNPTKCWNSPADFMLHLAQPHSIEYDIRYICLDDLIEDEEIPFEKYNKLSINFFVLYQNRTPAMNTPDEKIMRRDAFNYLFNSEWAGTLCEEAFYY